MSTLVKRIQDLVKRDKMDQALKELEVWASKNDDDLHNMIILQTARFNQLRRGERMGIMSREEASRTSNQIRYSVLSILEELPGGAAADTTESRNSTTSSPEIKKEKRDKPALKLFISYARKDYEFVEDLKKHLKILKRSGHLATWSDSDLTGGLEWSVAIEKELRSADIILYMVSVDFITSDFIGDYERIWAEETRAAKGTLIIPVIVRHCSWETEDFRKYGALPNNKMGQLTPISDWPDKDRAYTTIAGELKRIIDNK